MVASSSFLPDSAGTFLSGSYFRASSMNLLLTCLLVTILLKLKPRIPSESLRFVPTPSESYSALLRGGEGFKFLFCFVGVGVGFFGGVVYFLAGWGGLEAMGRGGQNRASVICFQSSRTIFSYPSYP